ncbi:MAG: 4-hydroxythreonine-4-phosphate dehydrogenase PdxA [Gemmatimonadota bacterium]|nr:4-hydroxythreonine-4-phosphate dehydrogenase PdxA [Gemmatimonadota bacterium]
MSRVAVTLGDPRGIGPEIVAKVMQDPPVGADFVILGPEELVARYGSSGEAVGAVKNSGVVREFTADVSPKVAGRLTALAVERAAEMALTGQVDAMVTGPAEKKALHEAGYNFPGHTEWLGQLAGANVAMMLASAELRVVLITTHMPLRRIFDELTTDRVVAIGAIAKKDLISRFRIAEPRLAICAVNPHAGEGGAFGDEDDTILRPAAEALGAIGPLPADTVFVRAQRGEFDAVLAPYHDVGMTAIKMAAFGRAVNVTLGLPFVRTSPDHGTAFDIAGRNLADGNSMREAMEMAVRLSRSGGER